MVKSKRKRFDGVTWHENYIISRTNAALAEKEKAFIRDHNGDSAWELVSYVRSCAKELGYTPGINEVIGGKYIASRLGGWTAVIQAAQLKFNHRPLANTKRHIFLKELEVQEALYRQDRELKRLAKLKNAQQ